MIEKLPADKIIECIFDDIDFYNAILNKYVFHYNEDDAICVYDISPEEAKTLRQDSIENDGEYWGAFLGRGGDVIDAGPDQITWFDEYLEIEGWCPIIDDVIDDYLVEF